MVSTTRTQNDLDTLDSPAPSQARNLCVAVFVGLILSTALIVILASKNPTTETLCNSQAATTQTPVLANTGTSDSIFKIKIISDMDRDSKVEGGNTWRAILKNGVLLRSKDGSYSLTWDQDSELRSQHSYNGRGMELSELIQFDGRLLTFDDTTGIVYEIKDEQAVPWQILSDGDGYSNKGFKCEWATLKGNLLYVGSMGKEWTDPQTAEVISTNPQWIKVISRNGQVQSLDWQTQYNALRKASGSSSPGYMIHESAVWHDGLQRWVFLPRRWSDQPYNEVLDEKRAANIMLLADTKFANITVIKNIGPKSEIRGFSSFRFVPGFADEFVALKTEEDSGSIKSYITVLNMKGASLMEEIFIDNVKFEGVEIF